MQRKITRFALTGKCGCLTAPCQSSGFGRTAACGAAAAAASSARRARAVPPSPEALCWRKLRRAIVVGSSGGIATASPVGLGLGGGNSRLKERCLRIFTGAVACPRSPSGGRTPRLPASIFTAGPPAQYRVIASWVFKSTRASWAQAACSIGSRVACGAKPTASDCWASVGAALKADRCAARNVVSEAS